jgi:tRNA(Ile)-lysidine synthase
MEYLDGNNVRWILDSSNLKSVYLRNRLRKELIPALKRFNPNIVSHLAKISSDYRDDDSLLNALAMKIWKKAADVSRNSVTINIPLLLTASPSIQKRLIMRSIKEILGSTRGYSHSHFEMILETARSRSPNLDLVLPGELRIERQYNKLIMTKASGKGGLQRSSHNIQIPLIIPGVASIEDLGIKVRARIIRKGIKLSRLRKTPPDQAYFDQKDIIPPLFIRGFRPGDRFQPFGLKGQKKVKDLFIEKKIPRSLRVKVPILDSGGGILWVLGLRQSEIGRVRKGVKDILFLEILKQGRIPA